MAAANLIIAILSVLVSIFIAYHIYSLQKNLSVGQRLRRAKDIRQETTIILREIWGNKRSCKATLINTRHYPDNYEVDNSLDHPDGPTLLGVELKSVGYRGVEFICGMAKQVYHRDDGSVTLKNTGEKAFRVFEVGTVPYDWIEHMDPEGNEYRHAPAYFVNFKGKDSTPYSSKAYYKIDEKPDKDHPWLNHIQRIEVT